jgi:hypothetical protein
MAASVALRKVFLDIDAKFEQNYDTHFVAALKTPNLKAVDEEVEVIDQMIEQLKKGAGWIH